MASDSAVWVEKYRPRTLGEMAGQEHVVPLLQAYAERRILPHLLFAGPPGVGKTTAALALAHDLYGSEWRQNFLELNASDERGIETVRTTIKGYARTAPLGNVPFKLLFLDEADNLTAEAQASLRRLMERYSGATRFILSCNYSSRIIEPIQSRCAVFRFRRLTPEQMRAPLDRIARAEHKSLDPPAWDAVLAASDGDLRQAVNLLQIASAASDHVTADMIGGIVTTPLRSEVQAMLQLALDGEFLSARERLYALFAERGASGEDVLRAIHAYLPDLPDEVISPLAKVQLVEYLGEVDYRLAEGASERIQLETVLARLARDAAIVRGRNGAATPGGR